VQPASARAPRSRRFQAALAPFILAHFLAYPVALVTALAAIPLGLVLRKQALLDAGNQGASSALVRDVARDLVLTRTEAAELQLMLEFILGASLVVLLLVHLAAVPWMRAAAASSDLPAAATSLARARRSFGLCLALLLGVVVVIGAGGWLWLFSL
jgi:hypothetical protein